MRRRYTARMPSSGIPSPHTVGDSAWRVAAIALAVAIAFYASLMQLPGVDFWLQAKIGGMVMQSGHIPDTVMFPFTEIADERFNAHEWLTSILFHYTLQSWGEQGMALFTGALGAGLFLLLSLMAYPRAGNSLGLALLTGFLALWVENYRNVLRPELVVSLLMALYWVVLEKFARAPRLWHAPAALLLVVLWTNSQGSFVLAVFLPAMYCAGAVLDQLRAGQGWRSVLHGASVRFAGMTALAALGVCINPFGLELVRFAFQFGKENDLKPLIGEWHSTLDPMMLKVRGFWIALAAWVLVLACLIKTRKALRSADWLIFAFFTLLAVKAIRFPLYLCFLVPLYVPPALLTIWPGALPEKVWHRTLSAVATLTLLLCIAFGNANGSYPFLDHTGTKLSRPMVETLRNPAYAGNVLNSMELGSELIYWAYPKLRPAIDCRLDSYGVAYYKFIFALPFLPSELDAFVKRYDVKYMLLSHLIYTQFKNTPAGQSGRWKVILVDEEAAFLARTD